MDENKDAFRVIDVNRAAMELGISPRRVRALIAAGTIKAVKIGGVWLIELEVISDVKNNRRSPGRPPRRIGKDV